MTSSPVGAATAGLLPVSAARREHAEGFEVPYDQVAPLALHGEARGTDLLGLAGADRLPDAFDADTLGSFGPGDVWEESGRKHSGQRSQHRTLTFRRSGPVDQPVELHGVAVHGGGVARCFHLGPYTGKGGD